MSEKATRAAHIPLSEPCRVTLPAKTSVPGIGAVSYADGEWYEDRGFAIVRAAGKRIIVHPAQGLIVLDP